METREVYGERGLQIVLKAFCKTTIDSRKFPQYIRICKKHCAKTRIIDWSAVFSISVCGNLWRLTRQDANAETRFFVWFSKSGKMRITKNPPKHWKG